MNHSDAEVLRQGGEAMYWDDSEIQLAGAAAASELGRRVQEADADDAIQSAWVSILETPDGMNNIKSLTQYLKTSSRRNAARISRKARLEAKQFSDFDRAPLPHTTQDEYELANSPLDNRSRMIPDPAPGRIEERQFPLPDPNALASMWRAIDELPSPDRDVILFMYRDGIEARASLPPKVATAKATIKALDHLSLTEKKLRLIHERAVKTLASIMAGPGVDETTKCHAVPRPHAAMSIGRFHRLQRSDSTT